MTLSLIIRHLLISLLPCVLGLAVGGSLAYGCALVGRRMLSANPRLGKWAMLIPWRTIMLALLFITTPLFFVRFFGIGDLAEAVSTGSTILLFVFPFTAVLLFEYWYPVPLRERFWGLARTFATASLILGIREAVGFNGGGGGIGFLMYVEQSRLHFQAAIEIWLAVVGLVLAVDLLFGLVQLVLYDGTRTGLAVQDTNTA